MNKKKGSIKRRWKSSNFIDRRTAVWPVKDHMAVRVHLKICSGCDLFICFVKHVVRLLCKRREIYFSVAKNIPLFFLLLFWKNKRFKRHVLFFLAFLLLYVFYGYARSGLSPYVTVYFQLFSFRINDPSTVAHFCQHAKPENQLKNDDNYAVLARYSNVALSSLSLDHFRKLNMKSNPQRAA